MTSKYFWILVVLSMLANQTEGWRRRRRRRCPRINCAVTTFKQWSSCSLPCGNGGTQTRTRTVSRYPSCGGSSCPPLIETRACNRGCSNGGTPLTGRCLCKSGYGGQCCTRGRKNLVIYEESKGLISSLIFSVAFCSVSFFPSCVPYFSFCTIKHTEI